MFRLAKYAYFYPIHTLILLSMVGLIACRKETQKSQIEMEPAGEPDQYSATVVRTIDDGEKREVITTHVARSGEQRREEWTEGGHRKALILRTADGKGFLLDLDARTYVELDIDAGGLKIEQTSATGSHPSDPTPDNSGAQDTSALGIDHYFEDTQPPTNRESLSLPSTTIDGHRCTVFEVRVTYPDGHVEITRMFRAADLSGLLIRVESENDRSKGKILTERRNVSLEINGDDFTVPADFKKDERSHPSH